MALIECKEGVLSASKDENTVVFNTWQKKDFHKIKNAIDKYRAISNKPIETSTHSISDLEKLSELKDKGIITDEEFAAKKKQILGI